MPANSVPAAEGRSPSAADRAYAHIKKRLLDGRFAGGTLLSENDLAKRLSMSRTPVRQAFLQLEAEGLLELYPRRGALVVPISPSEAEDVLEARLLIEQHCARSVAAEAPGGSPASTTRSPSSSEHWPTVGPASSSRIGGFTVRSSRPTAMRC